MARPPLPRLPPTSTLRSATCDLEPGFHPPPSPSPYRTRTLFTSPTPSPLPTPPLSALLTPTHHASSKYPAISPFADPVSPTPSICRSVSDPEPSHGLLGEKYNITPCENLLMFPHQVEDDDVLHDPRSESDDQGAGCNLFTWRGLRNVGGLGMVVVGVMGLLVGVPVV